MKDKPIFPQLSNTKPEPPLSESELENMWSVVRSEIRKPAGKKLPYLAMGLAASFLLVLGIFLTIPPAVMQGPADIAVPVMELAYDAPPLIEDWEGIPSLMYEGQYDTLKVAFIVDNSIEW